MSSYEQVSLFDIELPPNNIEKINTVISPLEETSIDNSPISFAKVPDEEFANKTPIGNIPTVDEILKMVNQGLHKVNAHEFLSDIFECGAIAVSNQFDKVRAAKREERYLQVIKKYDPAMQKLITEIFAKIYILLSQQITVGFNDYLGDLYMKSETSNKYTGQFFTPYCVSKLCAETAINGKLVNDYIEQDKVFTLNEPACGAGGMVLAATDVLYNKYHFNYSRNLFVECSDLDARCVYMSYLQLGLAGVPAVIYRRNTLTMETYDRWETPAYILNYLRFMKVENELKERR